MTDIVQLISQEMSLWKPQKLGLTKLHSIINSIALKNDLKTIEASIPGNIVFDTKFPSFTFDMATGTGKTKLMAGCITYLLRSKISKNFFILAPGDTIYRKLIRDFTKGHKKYVFQGLSDLPSFNLITGENYERYNPKQLTLSGFNVFIFNIQKIWKKDFKFHAFKETLGESFGNSIQSLPDLVLLMDESHHYRGDVSFNSVNELKPILGLEFTATPVYTKNIIYSYSLGEAIRDGLVKRVEAVIRKNDRSYEEELDQLKLEDGLKLHNQKKIYLANYCKNRGLRPITPLALISCKDIKHGESVQQLLESKKFLNGEFIGKTIYIHSKSEEEVEKEFLNIDREDNTREVVIHVNKAKEGWDVKYIYTIIPLRASISVILTEQTLGRGVRLPFLDVTKDDINEELEAFTLNVICYKPKGDNYRDVIKNAQNILVKDYDEDETAGRTLVQYELKASNKKREIQIPITTSSVIASGKLEVFTPAVTYDYQKDLNAENVGIDIESSKETQLGQATESTIENQFQYLVNSLIYEMDELDASDKDVVGQIVSSYLKTAIESSKNEDWEKFLNKHRRYVREDLENQIREQIINSIKVAHKASVEGYFQFRSYFISKDKDEAIKSKDSVADEEIKKGIIIGGYEKSIYPEVTCDSKQEKFLADILDKELAIKKWVKNQRGLIGIRYRYGTYYPDFFAESKDGKLYVIEVKSSGEIEDEIVLDKAKEAIKWCNALSKATKREWEYKLIPHDKITRADNLKGLFSNAIVLNQ
jgi:restriction endonuclease